MAKIQRLGTCYFGKTVLYYTYTKTTGADMQKVYIVQVQGWGDDENAFYNTSGHTTRKLADSALEALLAEAEADGLTDVVTNIEVLTIDA